MKYSVELEHISNENYELPSRLEKFEVNSNKMDEAITTIRKILAMHMTDKDDYFLNGGPNYENYAEISFGDADTGQDVRYSITKIED
ncbi:hypothetical protein CN918_29215 [Priestia megaterium]|nr:hypothetical protein CN918_29215 [Priestia megaterium]